MFFLSAAITSFGTVFYLIFASGTLQAWGREEGEDEDSLALKSKNSDVEVSRL